ncbi:H-NS family nucleoid-associated regulatory protein [Burkholderia gladioli]|uniref:Histone family protein nucleoid-structuring protein H-NS n=1 Tax=Burkholderia gladioli (strain BSR3) TaxID=999541 RepID=F2LSD0_BURGS|nr:H-NS histone family protein [Burkholderia gladioli]AEA65726.1 histone family protein nucleoid-structuring protein H-NS [Burkholderia gladioli BSR3]
MTTKTYRDLLKERSDLDVKIEAARKDEHAAALEKIKSLMVENNISLSELTGRRGPKRGTASIAPKYRDPQSGKTWTGRGKPPMWIAGKNRDDFLIAA